MTITHDQRADIGQRFLKEIDRRIEVRTAKKAAIKEPLQEDDPLVVRTALEEVLAMGFKLPNCKPSKVDVNRYGSRPSFDLEFVGGMELGGISQAKMPKTAALLADRESSKTMKGKLCNELEFLHRLKGGSNVGAFQAYIGRLWCPSDRTEIVSASIFKAHFDAFCDSKRGFVCEL